MTKKGNTRHLEKIPPPDDRAEILKIFEGLGAFYIAGRTDKITAGLDTLQRAARTHIMKEQLDTWVPEFYAAYEHVEEVIGQDLKLGNENPAAEVKQKALKAGYKNVREFATELLVPAVCLQALVELATKTIGIRIPPGEELKLPARLNALNRVAAAAGARMLQESMGL